MPHKLTGNLKSSIDEMLRLQEEQKFSMIYDEVPADLQPDRFTYIPGRVVYLINSRTSEVEWVRGDVKNMFRKDASEFRKLTDFYEHIVSSDLPDVINFTTDAMKWTFKNKEDLKPFENRVQVSFKLDGKRDPIPVTRNTYIAHQDSSGSVTHSLGIYEINTRNNARPVIGNIAGPYSESFKVEELSTFRGVISNAEIAILREVALGYKNSEIAQRLHLSVHTVETHRKNMLRKLEARNTPNLVYLAQRLGLI